MNFTHVARSKRAQLSGRSEAVIVDDGWDDHHFQTLFDLVLFDSNGQRSDVGQVKILSRGLSNGRVTLPGSFEALSSDFCSLGQDKKYYETLAAHELGNQVLLGLCDCVFNPTIFESFKNEKGFELSLLRSLPESSVTVEFRDVLRGQAKLTPFRFVYKFAPKAHASKPPIIKFEVDPDSVPPSNVHVVIGRNGAGKTHLLGNIAELLCTHKPNARSKQFGSVQFLPPATMLGQGRFANLVAITFSAFDPFRVPSMGIQTEGDIRYAYVGLRKLDSDYTIPPVHSQNRPAKELADFAAEFRESLEKCFSGPRRRRWMDAVKNLETDPGFEELDIPALMTEAHAIDAITTVFNTLSAGHRIVLLTVSRLVELVEERTLVLLDEPETHLHPPLLSSFIRVLSALLRLRNGVALIATHSPVVLQEVPKNCVWLLRRSGDQVRAERPEIETFGENVGVLTREVFGLEVTNSGFHRLIAELIAQSNNSYETTLASFHGQLGAEARAIIRALTQKGK